MFKFLLSLLIGLFSLQASSVPQQTREDLIEKFGNRLTNITEVVAPAQDSENNQGGNDQLNQGDSFGEESENSNNQNASGPDTNKLPVYNESSEKPIGQVAAVAAEKSPVLTPCKDLPPESCEEKSTKINPIPSPIPTQIPKPSITPLPEPTFIPCPPPPCLKLNYENKKNIYPDIFPCPEYQQEVTSAINCPEYQ